MLKSVTIDYLNAADQLKRRLKWFLRGLTFRKAANLISALLQYALKSKRLISMPIIVKIDVSPLCNLHCTICVHAKPNGDERLEKQHFDSTMKMSFEQYKTIIDQIKSTATAVSPYNLGDPLMHPDIERMCRYASDNGLNVHINTNFSFNLSDERIKSLATCGITHFTVCIDGMSQENYSKTRVGGKFEFVKSNLARLCAYKKKHGLRYPVIEAQYLKFPHNLDQLSEARQWLMEIGVDRMVDFYGTLHNYTVDYPGNYTIAGPKKKKSFPLCYWPYFFMVINYNGDVVPCCWFRIYAHCSSDPEDKSTVIGNVFKKSVREIWNSERFKIARQMVSNPETAAEYCECTEYYCDDCPVIFESDWRKNHRIAPEWYFEDLYSMKNGNPVRRSNEDSAELHQKRLKPGDADN
ncbi:SPASM domain-containing protein [Candidatus Latescibacterota bacterium]